MSRKVERTAREAARDKQRRLDAIEELKRLKERTKGTPTEQVWQAVDPTATQHFTPFVQPDTRGSIRTSSALWDKSVKTK